MVFSYSSYFLIGAIRQGKSEKRHAKSLFTINPDNEDGEALLVNRTGGDDDEIQYNTIHYHMTRTALRALSFYEGRTHLRERGRKKPYGPTTKAYGLAC